MRLTVMEPFRSIFYAPQFVALHLGHFAAEGLEVAVRTGADATGTTRALIDGTAQFSMGGIMRSLDLADRGGRFLVHFAEVNSRNGFFLLAREPRPQFTWADLAGRTVISFAGAPTPWQCMLTVLRRHGVDPARVTFVRDLHGDDAVRALISNDDGVHSPGLAALEGAARAAGLETYVVAPDREQSASSHALTMDRPSPVPLIFSVVSDSTR